MFVTVSTDYENCASTVTIDTERAADPHKLIEAAAQTLINVLKGVDAEEALRAVVKNDTVETDDFVVEPGGMGV